MAEVWRRSVRETAECARRLVDERKVDEATAKLGELHALLCNNSNKENKTTVGKTTALLVPLGVSNSQNARFVAEVVLNMYLCTIKLWNANTAEVDAAAQNIAALFATEALKGSVVHWLTLLHSVDATKAVSQAELFAGYIGRTLFNSTRVQQGAMPSALGPPLESLVRFLLHLAKEGKDQEGLLRTVALCRQQQLALALDAVGDATVSALQQAQASLVAWRQARGGDKALATSMLLVFTAVRSMLRKVGNLGARLAALGASLRAALIEYAVAMYTVVDEDPASTTAESTSMLVDAQFECFSIVVKLQTFASSSPPSSSVSVVAKLANFLGGPKPVTKEIVQLAGSAMTNLCIQLLRGAQFSDALEIVDLAMKLPLDNPATSLTLSMVWLDCREKTDQINIQVLQKFASVLSGAPHQLSAQVAQAFRKLGVHVCKLAGTSDPTPLAAKLFVSTAETSSLLRLLAEIANLQPKHSKEVIASAVKMYSAVVDPTVALPFVSALVVARSRTMTVLASRLLNHGDNDQAIVNAWAHVEAAKIDAVLERAVIDDVTLCIAAYADLLGCAQKHMLQAQFLQCALRLLQKLNASPDDVGILRSKLDADAPVLNVAPDASVLAKHYVTDKAVHILKLRTQINAEFSNGHYHAALTLIQESLGLVNGMFSSPDVRSLSNSSGWHIFQLAVDTLKLAAEIYYVFGDAYTSGSYLQLGLEVAQRVDAPAMLFDFAVRLRHIHKITGSAEIKAVTEALANWRESSSSSDVRSVAQLALIEGDNALSMAATLVGPPANEQFEKALEAFSFGLSTLTLSSNEGGGLFFQLSTKQALAQTYLGNGDALSKFASPAAQQQLQTNPEGHLAVLEARMLRLDAGGLSASAREKEVVEIASTVWSVWSTSQAALSFKAVRKIGWMFTILLGLLQDGPNAGAKRRSEKTKLATAKLLAASQGLSFGVTLRRQMSTLMQSRDDGDEVDNRLTSLYEHDLPAAVALPWKSSSRTVNEDDCGALLLSEQVSELLPVGWRAVVVRLAPSQHEMMFTILKKGVAPQMHQKSTDSIVSFLDTFKTILLESDETIRQSPTIKNSTEKNGWWAKRKKLDKRLEDLLASIDEEWLDDVRDEIVSPNVDAVAEPAVAAKTSSSRKKTAAASKQPVAAVEAPAIKSHVILVLDKRLQQLPWESFPSLRNRSVSRLPTLSFVRDRLMWLHENPRYTVVDPRKTYFVVNPSGDLVNTQTMFASAFQETNGWSGIAGSAPTNFASELPDHELVIYMGHNAGEVLAKPDELRVLPRCAVTLLIGCSSGELTEKGELEPTGHVLNFLFAKSPAVLANLWKVTDGEIDGVTARMLFNAKILDSDLEKLRKKKVAVSSSTASGSLCDALTESRNVCVLPFLTGAAPVMYGLPVTIDAS